MRLLSKFYQTIITVVVIAIGVVFIYHVSITQSLFNLKIKSTPTATPDYSTWHSYTNQKYGVSFKYPAAFQLVPGKTGPLAEWQLYGLTNGIEIVSIEIPSSFQIRTNFMGASLRIGLSTDATAVKECLSPPTSFGYRDAYNQRVIGGVVFQEFTRSDTAAGNSYEFTSYHAVRDTGCEVLEYSIHKTNIQNYPPEAGRKEFDHTAIVNTREAVLDTVQFVK